MEQMQRQEGIQMNLFRYFNDVESFTLKDAEEAVLQHYHRDVKVPSIRARIYEGIDKGLFTRVSKGVYTVTKKDAQGNESTCLLVNGNGRDLSFLEDNSIDALITDHPYKIDEALKGGNRDFATYELFQYEQKDFDEKCRVLKPGAFLLEFLPEESEVNFEYLYQVKKMAVKSGFKYFAKVPWKKGNFVANTGRTKKNREDIVFFSKGEPRALKLNTKKNKATAMANNFDIQGLDSYGLRDLLEEKGLEVAFMKGPAGMLPTEFDYQPRSKKEKVMEAEKPVELFDAILPYITLPGEKVLDQFAGSGNVGVSAVKNGRDAIIIEKDKETFEKMKENVERALGEKAVLQTEIEKLYKEIEKNDEELRIEYEQHGETVHASQVECANEIMEEEICQKEEKVAVLTTEAECYGKVLSLQGVDIATAKKVLNCSGNGDLRFCDEGATLRIHGVEKSIAEIYKEALRTEMGTCAETHNAINHVIDPYTGDTLAAKEASYLYRGLWITYLNNHPELVEEAAKYEEFIGSPLQQNQKLSSAEVIGAYIADKKQYIAVVKASHWYQNLLNKRLDEKIKNAKGCEKCNKGVKKVKEKEMER